MRCSSSYGKWFLVAVVITSFEPQMRLLVRTLGRSQAPIRWNRSSSEIHLSGFALVHCLEIYNLRSCEKREVLCVVPRLRI